MKRIKTLVVAIAGLFLAAASSHATLSTVNDLWGTQPGSGGEWNLYNTGVGANAGNGIMEYVYGNFTRVNDASDIQWVGSPGGLLLMLFTPVPIRRSSPLPLLAPPFPQRFSVGLAILGTTPHPDPRPSSLTFLRASPSCFWMRQTVTWLILIQHSVLVGWIAWSLSQ